MMRCPSLASSPVVSVSRMRWRMRGDRDSWNSRYAERRFMGRYSRSSAAGIPIPAPLVGCSHASAPIAFDRRLDLLDGPLDLVVRQIALHALAIGERERAIDLGLELPEAERLGDGGRGLVGERLRP